MTHWTHIIETKNTGLTRYWLIQTLVHSTQPDSRPGAALTYFMFVNFYATQPSYALIG